jgi:hypothetical protein
MLNSKKAKWMFKGVPGTVSLSKYRISSNIASWDGSQKLEPLS